MQCRAVHCVLACAAPCSLLVPSIKQYRLSRGASLLPSQMMALKFHDGVGHLPLWNHEICCWVPAFGVPLFFWRGNFQKATKLLSKTRPIISNQSCFGPRWWMLMTGYGCRLPVAGETSNNGCLEPVVGPSMILCMAPVTQGTRAQEGRAGETRTNHPSDQLVK